MGLLNTVTHYHYLRQNAYYGLNGADRSKAANKTRHSLALYPEVTITRNSVRELVESDYKLKRAMEITAEYALVCNTWNTNQLPMMNGLSSDEVFDRLVDGKSLEIKDILH